MNPDCPARRTTAILLLAWLAPLQVCAGQEAPHPSKPKDDPALTDPSNDDSQKERRPVSDEPPPVEPRRQRLPQQPIPALKTPGLRQAGLDSPAMPAAKFFPEGTLVTDRRGTVVLTEQHDAILIPAAGSSDPLLVLLPGQRLAQIVAARAAGGPQTQFVVSGQVFVYRDRQFLMPTVFAVEHLEPTPAPPGPHAAEHSGAQSQPKPAAGASQSADPRVEDLMRDLESHRVGPRRTMAPAPAPAPTSDNAVANSAQPIDPSLKPEGAVLVSRRGRLVRLAEQGGRLALVFDNDPDSPGPKPFVLHPCQLLERLESVASARGDDTTFRVSGRVTVFEGRNYLLPTFEQAIVQTDISPMQ